MKTCRQTAVALCSVFLLSSHDWEIARMFSISYHILDESPNMNLQTKLCNNSRSYNDNNNAWELLWVRKGRDSRSTNADETFDLIVNEWQVMMVCRASHCSNFTLWSPCIFLPSVLWHCWLGHYTSSDIETSQDMEGDKNFKSRSRDHSDPFDLILHFFSLVSLAVSLPEIWRGRKFLKVGHVTPSRSSLTKFCFFPERPLWLICEWNFTRISSSVTDIWLFYYFSDLPAKVLFEAILGRFLGVKCSQILSIPRKGTSRTRSTRFGVLYHSDRPRNATWTRAEESIKRKNARKETQRFDKSRMCPDHPRWATPTKVVMWGGVPHIVNHARFRQN